MPNYPYDPLNTPLDINNLQKANGNWAKIAADIQSLDSKTTVKDNNLDLRITQQTTRINNFVSEVSNDAFEQVVSAATVNRSFTPVANFSSLATTYPDAENGDAVQTLDDNKTYRFNGVEWVYIEQFGSGPFTEVFNRLDEQRYYRSVKSEGAVGDAVNDDTAAIQATIDDVAANGGGVVFIPHGRFRITAPLIVKSGVSLKGENFTKSVLQFYGNIKGINFENGDNFTVGFIEDICFEGHQNALLGINVTSAHEMHINRCNFLGFLDGGIEFFESFSTKVNNCRFAGMRYGVKMNSIANALYFYGCQFASQSEACALVGAGSSILFDGCNFELSGSGVKYIGGWLQSIVISNCYSEKLTNGMFYVPTMSASERIFGLTIEKIWHHGLDEDARWLNINAGNGSIRGRISDNAVFNCTSEAIKITGLDARIHCQFNKHWDYDSWAEKKVYSDDLSANVSNIKREFNTTVFDKGIFAFNDIKFQNQTTLPPASDVYRGRMMMVYANSTLPNDTLFICVLTVTGYQWKQVSYTS